jgi:hypothetical protein
MNINTIVYISLLMISAVGLLLITGLMTGVF